MTKESNRSNPSKTSKAKRAQGLRTTATPTKSATTFFTIATTAINGSRLPTEHQNKLKAMLGIEGHAKSALASDGFLREMIAQHLKSMSDRAVLGALDGWVPVKIVVGDDCGLSEQSNPQLHIKAIHDRAAKLMAIHKLEAFQVPWIALKEGESSPADDGIVLAQRIVAFAPPGTKVDDLQARLRSRAPLSTKVVPTVIVSAIPLTELAQAFRWLLQPPSRSVKLAAYKSDKHGWKPDHLLTEDEVLRTLALLAAVPMSYLLSGSGPSARKIVADVKSKAASGQRARVDEGVILDSDFDPYVLDHDTRMALGIVGVGIRTDLPMRAPAAPKHKTIAQAMKDKAKKTAAKRKAGDDRNNLLNGASEGDA